VWLDGRRVGGLEGWGLGGWRVEWRVGGLEGCKVRESEDWILGGLEGWRVGELGVGRL
jgi:hypothetical protein